MATKATPAVETAEAEKQPVVPETTEPTPAVETTEAVFFIVNDVKVDPNGKPIE